MKYPQLLCARNPTFPDEVACTVSLVPTFDPPPPQERFEILEDEEPEYYKVHDPDSFHFSFLLDRSGSMSGPRMLKAREALILFLHSLPERCKFSIISFGTNS